MFINHQSITISNEILDKWQNSVNKFAKIFEVAAITIVRINKDNIDICITSETAENPFKKNEKSINIAGTYCEKILNTGQTLQISNVLNDIEWKNSPDLANNLISYIGVPLIWPNGVLFGALNLYDNKIHIFSEIQIDILNEFKGIIEDGLKINYLNSIIDYQKTLEVETNPEKLENEEIFEYIDNEENYRQIVENLNSLIVKFNLSNEITFVNKQFCNAYGKSENELLGKPFINKVHYEGTDNPDDIFEKLKEHPNECEHEEKVLTINGLRWIKWSDKAIVDKKGQVIEIVSVGRDVTDRRSAIESLIKRKSEFKKIIEMNAIPMVVTDKNHNNLIYNKAFTNTFGYTIEDIPNSEIWFKTAYPNTEYRNLVMTEWNAAIEVAMLNQTDIKKQIWKPTCKNGSQKVVEFSFVSLGEQNIITMLDITEQKMIEEALILSEEKFKAAFKTSPDSININRLSDGLYLEINEGFTLLTGYTEEDVKDKTSTDINIWLDINDRQLLVKELVKKGYFSNLEARFRMKDGREITALMSAKTILLQNEPCIISITRNIQKIKDTEIELIKAKETAEKSERKYRDLFNEMLDGFALHEAIYNKDGNPVDYRFLDINPAYEKLMGFTREKIIGKTVLEIIPNFEQHWIINFGNVAKTGKPFHFENQAKESGKYYNGIAYSPQKDFFATVLSDVTEKKKAEKVLMEYDQNLKNQNEEYQVLNVELSELNQELIIAKEKAIESDKLKTAFLANMSHEIRTPMNGIMGFTGLLSKEGIDDNKKQIYIDIIQQNSTQLLSIINDLVDISKIEAGQIEIEQNNVNLDQLAQGVKGVYYQKSLDKKINFELVINKSGIEFVTDEIKLRQILINLLDNAFKFTQVGNISFGYQIKGKSIEFFVSDTGIGLDKNFHKSIFESFRQVELSSSRRYGGTGVGLSISKAYCEKMGGKIWVESELGKGAVFYFTLPYIQLKSAISNDSYKDDNMNSYNWVNKTILIAEDESVNYRFFEEIFEDTLVNLIWAQNGQEALDYCKQSDQIDLILMDIKMPVMNGYDATKAIKQIRPNIPIIAQTSYALIGDETKAREAGCDDYVHKPIDINNLMKKILKHFRT